jgi:alpha-2-macroglobulin
MKLRLIFALFLVTTGSIFAQPKLSEKVFAEYTTNKAVAETLYAEGSFAKANEIYAKVDITSLRSKQEARWVAFRFADTQWRSQFATETSDTTKIDQARSDLEKLVRDVTREDEHDRVWVEVQESLADFWWTRRHNNNWGQAWPYYQKALDWWAGAADIELARERYLKMVWRMSKPPQVESYYFYGYWGNYIPLDVLQNTLKIAKSDEDKAHAHYLIAKTIQSQGGDPETRQRVIDEFEAAIKAGKKKLIGMTMRFITTQNGCRTRDVWSFTRTAIKLSSKTT